MPVSKAYVILPWPGPIGPTTQSLSIGKSGLELARLISGLDIRNVILCSAAHSRDAIIRDNAPIKLAYLFRPTDVMAYREVIDACTHVQLLTHEQDDIEGFTAAAMPYIAGKKIAPLNRHQAELYGRYGLQTHDILPIPIEKFPDAVSLSVTTESLRRLTHPRVVMMSNSSIRKNLYRGLLAVLDAIKLYDAPVEFTVIANAANASRSNEIVLKYPFVPCNLLFFGTVTTEQLYSIVATSTTLVLPSIDEGYNMVLREMDRTGIEIICTDIPANRDYSVRSPSCFIVPAQETVVYPADKDEISRPIYMRVPKHRDLTLAIEKSIRNFNTTKERMIKRMQAPSLLYSSNVGISEGIVKFLGIPKKRDKTGAAVLRVI